jgi:hypothetical protein
MLLALLAYRRSANAKVLGIAVAFGLFFAKGVAVTWALFTQTSLETVWVTMGLLDTGVLLTFYLSALKP